LKEHVNRLIIIGTGVIILGSISAVLSGDHVEQTHDLQYFLHQMQRPLFLTYFFVLIMGISSVVYSIRVLEDLDFNHELLMAQEELAPPAHSINADNQEFSEEVNSEIILGSLREAKHNLCVARMMLNCGLLWNCTVWRKRVLSVVYPLLAGMIGSITLLSAKGAADVVKSGNDFGQVATYMFFLLVLILGPTQIHVLNLGLKKFDQIVVIPVFTVALESFSVIISIIFFEEYFYFNLYQSIFFPVSILVTYIGVYLTAIGQKTRDSENHIVDMDAAPEGFNKEQEPAAGHQYVKVEALPTEVVTINGVVV
jgi:energy-converting hydrogenase Eha subunit C